MKVKLVQDNWLPNLGLSVAKIKTELGHYSASVFLKDEDRDIASRYEGIEYAEMRAYIKYLSDKIKMKKIEVDTLRKLKNLLESLKDYNKNCHEARTVRKQYFIKRAELNELYDQRRISKELLLSRMQNYRKNVEETRKKIERLRRNKKNEQNN